MFDVQEGIREVSLGTGEVRICVGYKIEKDKMVLRNDVPIFKTMTF